MSVIKIALLVGAASRLPLEDTAVHQQLKNIQNSPTRNTSR